MVWLVCKQSSRPDSFPGLKFHFQTFRSTIPRNEFQPLPSEAKSMSRSEPFSTLTNLEPAYIGPRHHTKRTIHLLSQTSVCYYPNIQFQICCSDATIQSPHLPASTGRNVSNFPIRSPPRTVFPNPTNHHQASPLDPSAPLPIKPAKHHKTITPRFKQPCRPEKAHKVIIDKYR
jgi:hypothetical protein